MARILHFLPLGGLVAFALVASCGGGKTNFGDDSGVDANVDDAISGSDIGFNPIEASDAPPCTTCSSDLHYVLSCGDNTVVQTCGGSLGCGPGGCIDACTAAAASKSSIGCDYYAVAPDAWTHGSCFAAFVTNNWSTDMKVSLTYKGTTIDATPYSYLPKGTGSSITYQAIPSSGIPQGGMAIVFINQMASSDTYYVACPAGTKAAYTAFDVASHETSKGNAVEITTSVPSVVYDIYPYGGALSYMSSATLLFPTTAWDTNFVAATMNDVTAMPNGSAGPGIDVVAQQDGTQVTILPTTNITALNGVAGATKNSPVVYSLNKGQQLRLMEAPDVSNNDLTGSIIQSNYPVGVWGEHRCMTILTPPPWRLVGAVKGTKLTYDPPVSGAPTTLDEGQKVEFAGPAAFRVSAQDNLHPFYLAGHRPGGDCDASHQQIPSIQALGSEYVAIENDSADFGEGGPETVNMIAPQQFLTAYTFFTDPTYLFTDLALVRVKASDNTFKDVKLDCLGSTPVSGWQAVGTSGLYQYVHVFVQKNGAAVGACNNGLHTISSDGQIGITVWGYGSAVSYAYPAGASIKPINTVIVPPVPH